MAFRQAGHRAAGRGPTWQRSRFRLVHAECRRWLFSACIVGAVIFAGCSDPNDSSDIGAWLRASAGPDVSREVLVCTESAADALLSEDDRRIWLSHDPETITVEEMQQLPRAIEVADRCRHLLRGPPP